MTINFTKMHGAGNDYVYIDGFRQTIENPTELARSMSNRNFGVGSDGLILILPSVSADIRMRMFNADGSEAEMCGNGIRCVAKYAFDHGLVDKQEMVVETGAGALTVQLYPGPDGRVGKVRVNMGPPRLTRGQIPMTGPAAEQAINIELTAGDEVFSATCVSMGNPHCVIYVDDVERFPVTTVGPLIESHSYFPERINVEFVEIMSPTEVRQRTWERGAGETLACGTGASAVTVAGVLNGKTEHKIVNHLGGGDLELEWSEDGDVFMVGPAVEVFSGVYEPR